jgi:tetratricopeptide (TPR) repeat protein
MFRMLTWALMGDREGALSTRLLAASALAWGVLVWANWFTAFPVSPRRVATALAAYAEIRPAPLLRVLPSHLASAGTALLLALAALGWGSGPARFLGGWTGRGGNLVRIAVGAGAMGLAGLGLGLSGLVRGPLFWLLAVGGAAGGARVLRPSLLRAAPSAGMVALCSATAIALLVALVGALAPEISYDALFHHLAHPKAWSVAGRIHGMPHHFLSWYPALLETQYLWAFALGGGAGAAKMVHYSWGLLTLAALYGWAREYMEAEWALLAGLVFLLTPYVMLVFMWAYVDLGASGYLTLALWGLASRRAKPPLTGVLAGLCAGTKAAGIFAPVIFAGFLALRRAGRRAWLGLACGFLAVAFPWGARNFLWTGNPFAPFLSGLVPTLWWGAGNQARYSEELASYTLPFSGLSAVPRLLSHPWNASVRNAGVLDEQAGMAGWYLWGVPFLLLAGRRAFLPARFALAWFVLWLFIPRQVRYLLPALPAAAIAVAQSLRLVASRGGAGLLAPWAAGLVLVLQLFQSVQRQHFVVNPLPYTAGNETAEHYLSRGLPGRPYSVWMQSWLLANRPGARYLVMADYGSGMLWGARAVFQSAFDTPLAERFARESDGAARIRVKFRQLGTGEVLYAATSGFLMQAAYGINNFDDASAGRWRDFWARTAVPVHDQNCWYTLYSLSAVPAGGKVPPKAGALPGLEEQWLGDLHRRLMLAEERQDPAAMRGVAADYEEAGRIHDSPAAWERAGAAALRLGDLKRAAADLGRARALGRRTGILGNGLGVVAAKAGRWDEAERLFREAVSLDFALENARANLASVVAHRGRRAEALGILREGLLMSPGSVELNQIWTALGGPALMP